jgi:hypothetical protein
MIDYLASFINTDGASFPDTKAVNVTAPGAGDGTEFVELLVNDIWGRAQALMDYAGLTPDGVTEAPDTAQFLEALAKGYAIGPGIGVIYWKSGTPIANGDRVLLLQGQVILISSYPLLAAAVYCGDANNATAPAFYKTSDAGGTTRSTSGTYLVLPDLRGLSLKNIGDATVNGRTKVGPVNLGEVQEDQEQGHYHNTANGTNQIKFGPGSYVISNGTGAGQANITVTSQITDGTHDTPRIGYNTRDSTIGTNFAITY